jgi:hypothetical protein
MPSSLSSTVILFGMLLLTPVFGCAHSAVVAPFHVRAGAPPGTARPLPNQPIVVDFRAGDRIPVVIRVDGEVVETTPNPSTVWLSAKRDFSVRIRGSEVKTSLDGVSFDDKPAVPGHFQFGFELTLQGGPKVVVAITTPQHAKH